MAVNDWVDDELRRSKDPGWTFTNTERRFLARIERDRALIEAGRQAVEALMYYRNHLTGHEPSVSLFERKVDEALAAWDKAQEASK